MPQKEVVALIIQGCNYALENTINNLSNDAKEKHTFFHFKKHR